MQPRLIRISTGLAMAALLAASAVVTAAAASPLHQHAAGISAQVDPAKVQVFRNAMGKLWEDHITWTRLYLVSALAGLPDTQATAERLLQNQVDIGNAIKPFYGEAAGDQLAALLRDHILIATDIVAAAKAGDTARLNAAVGRWQTNADQIGDFLGAANPTHWPADEAKAMMREHLDLTTAELMARLNQDWTADVAAYDRIHLHILELADMLSNGLVAQFPEQFA